MSDPLLQITQPILVTPVLVLEWVYVVAKILILLLHSSNWWLNATWQSWPMVWPLRWPVVLLLRRRHPLRWCNCLLKAVFLILHVVRVIWATASIEILPMVAEVIIIVALFLIRSVYTFKIKLVWKFQLVVVGNRWLVVYLLRSNQLVVIFVVWRIKHLIHHLLLQFFQAWYFLILANVSIFLAARMPHAHRCLLRQHVFYWFSRLRMCLISFENHLAAVGAAGLWTVYDRWVVQNCRVCAIFGLAGGRALGRQEDTDGCIRFVRIGGATINLIHDC